MNNPKDFFEESKQMISEFDKFMQENDLIEKVKPDHICYKCENSDSFIKIRTMFEPGAESKWLHQSIISGRRIALIRTKELFQTSVGNIDLIELSDQKPDNSQTDGFDHIEIYPTQGTYDELVEHLKTKGHEIKEVVRPHHTTHDISIPGGFLVRLTRESLYDKVPQEMVEERI